MKKVYFKTAKYFNIPGFRKGKVNEYSRKILWKKKYFMKIHLMT